MVRSKTEASVKARKNTRLNFSMFYKVYFAFHIRFPFGLRSLSASSTAINIIQPTNTSSCFLVTSASSSSPSFVYASYPWGIEFCLSMCVTYATNWSTGKTETSVVKITFVAKTTTVQKKEKMPSKPKKIT